MIRLVYVIYDDECGFCVGCRRWLSRQVAVVPMRFLPMSSAEGRLRTIFGAEFDLELGGELMVITDEGAVYCGDNAFLMCLWCLRGYRPWAKRLSKPGGRGMARRAYQFVSSRRYWLSRLVGVRGGDADHDLEAILDEVADVPVCVSRGGEGP